MHTRTPILLCHFIISSAVSSPEPHSPGPSSPGPARCSGGEEEVGNYWPCQAGTCFFSFLFTLAKFQGLGNEITPRRGPREVDVFVLLQDLACVFLKDWEFSHGERKGGKRSVKKWNELQKPLEKPLKILS